MALFMFLTTGSCLSAFGLVAEVLVVDLNSDALIFIYLKSKQAYDGCEDLLQRVELLW
jgi:hypothetical protein